MIGRRAAERAGRVQRQGAAPQFIQTAGTVDGIIKKEVCRRVEREIESRVGNDAKKIQRRAGRGKCLGGEQRDRVAEGLVVRGKIGHARVETDGVAVKRINAGGVGGENDRKNSAGAGRERGEIIADRAARAVKPKIVAGDGHDAVRPVGRRRPFACADAPQARRAEAQIQAVIIGEEIIQRLRDREGIVGAVDGGVAHAGEIRLDLQTINRSAGILRGVHGGVVAAVEIGVLVAGINNGIRAVARIRHGERGHGRITARGHQPAETIRAAQNLGKGHGKFPAGDAGERADAALQNVGVLVQPGVGVGQLVGGQQIAEFQALDRMPLAVQINVKTEPALRHGRVAAGVDKILKFVPRLRREHVGLINAFREAAVAINLGALQLADDDMRTVTEVTGENALHRERGFLGVSIGYGREIGIGTIILAVGNFRRRQRSPVRRGKNHRQIARDIFGVITAAEVNLAGDEILRHYRKRAETHHGQKCCRQAAAKIYFRHAVFCHGVFHVGLRAYQTTGHDPARLLFYAVKTFRLGGIDGEAVGDGAITGKRAARRHRPSSE